MNTPETINIEKYANALNNLIGVDSAYLAGDKDVDAIVELIVAAKKLENRVKELTEENDKLKQQNEAHWIYEAPWDPRGVGVYKCSRCGVNKREDEVLDILFCPKCGSHMKGDK